jgi:hypothetical protein
MTVYFLIDLQTAPIGVRRTLELRPGAVDEGGIGDVVHLRPGASAWEALQALIAGPTEMEKKAGITSVIPADTRILSFSLKIGGAGRCSDAFVNLAGLPPANMVGAPSTVRATTQVTRTLVGLLDICRVWLHVDDQPWDLADIRGNIVDRPHDYDQLLGFFQICTAKPGTEAVPGDCFTALP